MTNIRYSAQQVQKRTLVARLMPGTELLAGIEAICREYNIETGAISTILGSLKQLHYTYPVPYAGTPANLKYCDPITIDGPIEILCGAGTIGVMKDTGKRVVHLHTACSGPTGMVYGGHLLDTGNLIAVTAEIVIEALDGATLTRALDEETGMPLFSIEGE